jgi:hypothetical protein
LKDVVLRGANLLISRLRGAAHHGAEVGRGITHGFHALRGCGFDILVALDEVRR